ncbi:MAG: GpE family phage tail protein [Aeromonas sp.]
MASVFHWPPAELYALPVSDLVAWHERAVQRAGHSL